jgi:Tol biopolymer transport system component
VTAPPGVGLGTMGFDFAISPDGKVLAFAASDSSGTSSIWIRELGGLTVLNLDGTENALGLFWSPDSRSLGFFAAGKLKKIAVSGGSPEVLCDAASPRGGSWSRDNVILFVPQATGGLFRISSDGGKVEEVLGPNPSRQEVGLRFPQFLPDGKQFLFLSMPSRQGNYDIQLGTLGSKERVLIMRAGAAAVWAEPGYLVTVRNQRLVAQRFDPASRKLVGEPLDLRDAPLIQGPYGGPAVSASRNGVLAYSASRLANTQVSLWDRAGLRHGALSLPPGRWEGVWIAPDGRHAMVGRRNSSADTELWLVNLGDGVASRFTPAVIDDGGVGWAPASDRVAYIVKKTGPEDIYVKPLEGGGAETPLVVSAAAFKEPYQWTPDGRHVVFTQSDPQTGFDVWRVAVDGDQKPESLVRTAANESGGWVSPDGRWLAYASDESGRDELYAQSYPVPARRQQLTTTGVRAWYGTYVVSWSRDGRELLFFDGDVRAMEIETGPTMRAGAPRRLFTPPAGVVGFGVTPDHQRFLVSEPIGAGDASAIGLDLNWAAALEKR